MRKTFLYLLFMGLCFSSSAQTSKDEIFEQDIDLLVEELQFMYGYDQTLREYTLYKTFDKTETNRIEALPDSLRRVEMKGRQFVSDTINTMIFRNYINPMDARHTARLIEITKKYGFPSTDRIRKYYDKEFQDPEFSPFLLFIHAPKEYWEELKVLMKQELETGRINRCTYGYLLWHVNGRSSFQPMLDNGYVMEKKEDGSFSLQAEDCE